jgi:predicted dehydrogenase
MGTSRLPGTDGGAAPIRLTAAARVCEHIRLMSEPASPWRVAVIGFGYWGPNLARNFTTCPATRLVAVADAAPARRKAVSTLYPWVRVYEDASQAIADPEVDAVAIATPLFTHYPLAKAALEAGKHVLVEKPLAPSVAECEELAALAQQKQRVLMVDHTFVYTSAVRKIRELIESGHLGRVLYFDSVRINLGLFQPDFNVIWDLAPHDLSIMDFVLNQTFGATPRWVSATGVSHYGRHESLAYLTIGFDDGLIAHVHVNWVAPVKTRRIIIAGTKRMLVYDDTSPVEPIKVYESSVDVEQIDRESAYHLNVQYRTGDVLAPKLDGKEALGLVASTFAAACQKGQPSPSDVTAGIRVVRLLEAAQQSLGSQGARVTL